MTMMKMSVIRSTAPPSCLARTTSLLWLVLLWAQQTAGASFLVSRHHQQTRQQQQQHVAPCIPSPLPSFAAARRSALNSVNNKEEKDSISSSAAAASDAAADAIGQSIVGRRTAVASLILVGSSGILSTHALAADSSSDEDDASFAAIAARATQITKVLDQEAAATAANIRKSEKTAYDFELPIAQENVKFQDVIRQEFYPNGVKVKAIVVVNIKQDDPIARKCIPELISIATKYAARNQADSAIAIICCPTDQGYFEPDTSALLRLKLASEYGYGINPATVITDKMNLLGTGAHPFWRWLESTSRTPAGLGRIQGNFEKFLLDGRTGLPVRRYPRRYAPLNMVDDIEAVIAGRPLPPARANWLEEWRVAAAESERDTYRFEKGLNWFDQ